MQILPSLVFLGSSVPRHANLDTRLLLGAYLDLVIGSSYYLSSLDYESTCRATTDAKIEAYFD